MKLDTGWVLERKAFFLLRLATLDWQFLPVSTQSRCFIRIAVTTVKILF